MIVKIIMSLILFVGISVSADIGNVGLDFERRQPVPGNWTEEIDHVVVNVQTYPKLRFLGASRIDGVRGLDLRRLKERVESEMTRLAQGCVPHYEVGSEYKIVYSCNDDRRRLFAEAHTFVFKGSVPADSLKSNMLLPLGHFYVPGIERVRVVTAYTDQGVLFDYADTDEGMLGLRIRSGVVQFSEELLPSLKEFVGFGLIRDDAHIVFEFEDGTTKLYSLDGLPLGGPAVEEVAPVLSISFADGKPVIKITGTPGANFAVEETGDFTNWKPWSEMTIGADGFATQAYAGDEPLCYFRIK